MKYDTLVFILDSRIAVEYGKWGNTGERGITVEYSKWGTVVVN